MRFKLQYSLGLVILVLALYLAGIFTVVLVSLPIAIKIVVVLAVVISLWLECRHVLLYSTSSVRAFEWNAGKCIVALNNGEYCFVRVKCYSIVTRFFMLLYWEPLNDSMQKISSSLITPYQLLPGQYREVVNQLYRFRS